MFYRSLLLLVIFSYLSVFAQEQNDDDSDFSPPNVNQKSEENPECRLSKDSELITLLNFKLRKFNPASKEFEKLLNSQLSKTHIEEGKIIDGKINKITDKFCFLFIEGLKSEPVLDVNELKSMGLSEKIKIDKVNIPDIIATQLLPNSIRVIAPTPAAPIVFAIVFRLRIADKGRLIFSLK